MFIDETTSREDLENAIISEDELYYSLDEQKFLNREYEKSELLEHVQNWVEAGNEAAC